MEVLIGCISQNISEYVSQRLLGPKLALTDKLWRHKHQCQKKEMLSTPASDVFQEKQNNHKKMQTDTFIDPHGRRRNIILSSQTVIHFVEAYCNHTTWMIMNMNFFNFIRESIIYLWFGLAFVTIAYMNNILSKYFIVIFTSQWKEIQVEYKSVDDV